MRWQWISEEREGKDEEREREGKERERRKVRNRERLWETSRRSGHVEKSGSNTDVERTLRIHSRAGRMLRGQMCGVR